MTADQDGYYIVVGDLNGNPDSEDIKTMIKDLRLRNTLEIYWKTKDGLT
jgi:hypothetical protein